MARYFNVALCLAAVVVAVSAQFDFFGGFGAASLRDRRDNGPDVFPAAPSGGSETSGVVVGNNVYGFVPPGSQQGGSRPHGSGPSSFNQETIESPTQL